MEAPGAHHPINQTPCPCAGLELQHLIVEFTIISSCHYHSLVDICSSQKTARSWELSRIDPLGRVLHQQLRGGEDIIVKVSVERAAGDEEDLGPLLILKVAAPMIPSALL